MSSNIRPKRGLRSFYPTDKGPIDLYQLGHDGRIEYLQAQIAVDHLTKGQLSSCTIVYGHNNSNVFMFD